MSNTELSKLSPEHHGPTLARKDGYDVIVCKTCGFAHIVPLPSAEDMTEAYREEYYKDQKPDYLAEAAEDQEWAELMQKDRLAAFARLVGPERRRLLDIGSGPGFFLKTAQAEGWQAKGIEPSRQAGAFARSMGVDVVDGFFSSQTAPELGRFDVVHLNNVLEHLSDPAEIIRLAADVLDPGGLICVNVPNEFTPIQQAGRLRVGAAQWWVAPPHHINYFDFASLSALVERYGLHVVEKTTSFPMELFLLMGDNYIGNHTQGRICHGKRKSFDLALEAAGAGETRRALYRALAEAGIGREAVVIARKA